MTRHPGRVLAEEFMRPLGISASHLASRLGVNRSTIGRLTAGKLRMTPGMAARLGAFFGVPARWWLLMQLEYDAQELAARPEYWTDVTPLEADPDILLTPAGVVRLDAPGLSEPEQPVSIPRQVLAQIPQTSKRT